MKLNYQNDKDGENISKKNPYYGEYTFHYWLWKNQINNLYRFINANQHRNKDLSEIVDVLKKASKEEKNV